MSGMARGPERRPLEAKGTSVGVVGSSLLGSTGHPLWEIHFHPRFLRLQQALLCHENGVFLAACPSTFV